MRLQSWLVGALMVPLALLPSTGCSSCNVDCSGTPLLSVAVPPDSEAQTVQMCIDGDCTTQALPADDGSGARRWVYRSLPGDGQLSSDGLQFDVEVRDANGRVLASRSERRTSPDECACDSITYRLIGDSLERGSG